MEAKPTYSLAFRSGQNLIAAVFTSSPEYNFEFKELNDHKAEFLIKGSTVTIKSPRASRLLAC
jgi:hypothetical protein